jgi:hypothetical protein
MYAWIGDLLVGRTGQDVHGWNARIQEQGFSDEASLRRWLTDQGRSALIKEPCRPWPPVEFARWPRSR